MTQKYKLLQLNTIYVKYTLNSVNILYYYIIYNIKYIIKTLYNKNSVNILYKL